MSVNNNLADELLSLPIGCVVQVQSSNHLHVYILSGASGRGNRSFEMMLD